MATTPNKKSTIHELMYLEQGRKDREREAVFRQYGQSDKRSTEHQGVMVYGENALGCMHPSFTVNGHGQIIFVDEVPPMMSKKLGEVLDELCPTISRIDPKKRYFPPDEED